MTSTLRAPSARSRAASASLCAQTAREAAAKRRRGQRAPARDSRAPTSPTGARWRAPPARRVRAQPASRFGQISVSISIAEARPEMLEEALHRLGKVVGQVGDEHRCRHRPASASSRPAAVVQVMRMRWSGNRAAQRPHQRLRAARASPTETAWTQMSVRRPIRRVDAEALADRLAVAGLAPPAPPEAQQRRRAAPGASTMRVEASSRAAPAALRPAPAARPSAPTLRARGAP